MRRKPMIMFAVFLALAGGSAQSGFVAARRAEEKPAYAASEPLNEPRLFAEGIISTDADEFGASFTPDGKTVYFTLKAPSTTNPFIGTICTSHFENGKWTTPEIVPFSGHYRDLYPFVSPDGTKLYFVSNRPVHEGDKQAQA